jgi:translation initiation factor 3 subunit D
LAVKKVANVYATDSVLVVLMADLRSAYSFDIVVTKDVDGNIFLDKRDPSFDLLSVNENSNEPPLDEADPTFNSVEPLHKEATTCNENFSQQVLFKEGEGIEFSFPNQNPFASIGDLLPSVSYEYKTFDLGDNVKICVRTELDSFEVTEIKNVQKTRNILVKSLLEYDQKVTGGWRMKLENQKAGCFATELKNNNCKLTKWVLQAHMSGASNLKLGWISRINGNDPYVHSILGVTDHPMREITSELGIDMTQVWGGLKHIVSSLQKQPEGSYILVRDPTKKNIYIYKTSPGEFRKPPVK